MEIGNWVDADENTGRIIHIPNGKIFTETLANYGKGFEYIFNEIPVLVTFESDWEKAKKILERIAKDFGDDATKAAEKKIKKASQKFLIGKQKLHSTVYTKVADSGVLLTIRYLCMPKIHIFGSLLIDFYLKYRSTNLVFSCFIYKNFKNIYYFYSANKNNSHFQNF